MEKKYLLLRNGHQSGPFTIGELFQQQMKSSDMIWVEGKSTAWAYMSELEFMPVVSEKLPEASETPVIPLHPEDEIERKAEELRKRALSYVPRTKQDHAPVYPRRSQPVETEETPVQFIDYSRKKNPVVQEVLMSVLIIALFGGVLYGSRSFFNQEAPSNSVATQIISADHHAAIATIPVVTALPPQEKQVTSEQSSIVADSATVTNMEPAKPAVIKKTSRKPAPVKQITVEPVAIANTEISTQPSVPPAEDLAKNDIVIPQQKETVAPVEKKKTVGETLRGLFKKKKKDDSKKTDPSEQQ